MAIDQMDRTFSSIWSLPPKAVFCTTALHPQDQSNRSINMADSDLDLYCAGVKILWLSTAEVLPALFKSPAYEAVKLRVPNAKALVTQDAFVAAIATAVHPPILPAPS